MRALILAPHPDDEINVAGASIVSPARAGVEIFVAYSTCGDFDRTAELRAEEALTSLSILGVDRDHIIWLGYGDTFNGTGKPHVFYADEPARSPAGHVETYAPKNFSPWRRSTYTRKNFLADLESLIVDLRAEIIFCVDLDFHADHRALALAFDCVMSSILRRTDYRPTIYKKLAYATAFTAPQDLHSKNLLSTPRPRIGLEAYDFDLIDKFNYIWSERVRLPVPEDCRRPLLSCNPIARAVFAHRSQRIQRNALAIINADEVFFERRTDSITFDAHIRATSGDPSKACDFQFLDLEDINASPPTFANYFWAPAVDDLERRLTFEWAQRRTIERIKIYGVLDGLIDKLRVSLDNITVLECRVERGGRPTVIDLPRPLSILRAEFSILDRTVEGGISEIEIFPSKAPPSVLPPFVKILCGDEFIYDYAVARSTDRLELGLYRYRFDGRINFSVDGGLIETRDGDRITIKLLSDVITVRASGDENVFDAITIRRRSPLYFFKLRARQCAERLVVRWRRHWR